MVKWSLAAMALVATLASAPVAAQDCDRICLADLVTTYVDALVADDPSILPLAETVRFTENSDLTEIGEGLWDADLEPVGFRHDYLDTAKQVAAAHVAFMEGEIPVLLSLALHVEGGRIAGIETIVQRITPDSPFQPTVLGEPVRGLDDAVPADQRMGREAMIATALTYAEGLRVGNFTDGETPFAPEAYRVENGVITAGDGCGRSDCGMYDHKVILHPAIIPSVVAVDEENATVLLWMNFGDTGSYGPGNALVTFEAFKVWGGEIHAVNAFFTFLPARTPRFWPSSDPLP